MPMVGLCDCNNFFASCERVFNPSLMGRAVVILSGNDGCIIARSNEAKALGIKMGQPFYQVKDIIKSRDVAVYSGNMPLYGDMSGRVMSILRQNLPSIEVYSVDEAFLDLSAIPLEQLEEYCRELSRKVRRSTGIPVSIGVAPTKTLAKVAAKLCKQYPKLNGACLLYRREDIDKVMRNYPVTDIWGIGRRFGRMLTVEGVYSARDFMQRSPSWVRSKMHLPGLNTWRELHGEAVIEFENNPQDRKSISVSRSFAEDIYDVEQIRGSLTEFATKAAAKLRKEGLAAGEMQTYIYTNRHRQDRPQSCENRVYKFERHTNSTLELVKCATSSLSMLFKEGYGYKKGGIILSDIIPISQVQNVLFDSVDREKHERVMDVMDRLNSSFGNGTLSMASHSGAVSSKREHLSQEYTTKFSDIIKIKV